MTASVISDLIPHSADDHGLSAQNLLDLFTAIRPELLAVLRRRTKDAEVAADLVQDLFVRLLSIRTILPDQQQARAYVFRMAVNIAIDRARCEMRRQEILNGIHLLFEDAVPDPETLAVSRDQIRRIAEALDELPPKCREVFMLARVQGLPHKEIAAHLGVSISLVEKYQSRAFRHCKGRLAEHRS